MTFNNMKKILVINGHPGVQSLSLELAKSYVAGAKKGGASVKELHIKDLTFDPVLHEGYKKRQELEPDLQRAQELIKWADHLVVFSPVWWSNIPALFKGFIDRTFLPGFAFKKMGAKWKRLLKGRTARLVLTSGAPAIFYRVVMRAPVDVSLGYATLKFCGFKTYPTVLVGNAENLSKKKKQKYINKLNNFGLKQK